MNDKRYTVHVDDNFNYMDEGERYVAGRYDSLEEAVAACRDIVEASLSDQYVPGMTAAELVGRYHLFGEDPWISGVPAGIRFSAWDYADMRSVELTNDVK